MSDRVEIVYVKMSLSTVIREALRDTLNLPSAGHDPSAMPRVTNHFVDVKKDALIVEILALAPSEPEYVMVHRRGEGGTEYSIHTRIVYTKERAEAKAAELNRAGNPHGSFYSAEPVGASHGEPTPEDDPWTIDHDPRAGIPSDQNIQIVDQDGITVCFMSSGRKRNHQRDAERIVASRASHGGVEALTRVRDRLLQMDGVEYGARAKERHDEQGEPFTHRDAELWGSIYCDGLHAAREAVNDELRALATPADDEASDG